MYRLSPFLFDKSGNVSPNWQKSLVNLPGTKDKFKIFFMGTIGSGFMSDIAIDDVRIHDYTCESAVTAIPIQDEFPADPNTCADNEFTCVRDKRCIKKWYICDGIQDCTDGSDEDECGFSNAQANRTSLDFLPDFGYTTVDPAEIDRIFSSMMTTSMDGLIPGDFQNLATKDPFQYDVGSTAASKITEGQNSPGSTKQGVVAQTAGIIDQDETTPDHSYITNKASLKLLAKVEAAKLNPQNKTKAARNLKIQQK